MILKNIYTISFFLCLFSIVSCKSGSNGKNTLDSTNDESLIDSGIIKKGVIQKLDYAIVNLKSSDDFIKNLSKQANLYDEQELNSVKKISEYESSKAKALNVGAYGADLNYIIHFNQIPVSFKYLLCAKQLSDQIGVAMAFDKEAVTKFNGNVDQKDTLINIVSSAYDVIKKYLRNGDQFLVASLVMSGSWVENMHLTLNAIEKCSEEQDKKRIYLGLASQKEYVTNLIDLLQILNEPKDTMIIQLVNGLSNINIELTKVVADSTTNSPKIIELKNSVSNLRSFVVGVK